ncbi:MAG: F0F1 ATP synthase subunit A [Candidatus Dependentiae bacterium]|nr:F0F1 ATP synthase subunit A [Candidatus Dependentiae bacterium]
MKGTELLEIKTWTLYWLGLDHKFFEVNIPTITGTWITIFLLILILIPINRSLRNKNSILRHAVTKFIAAFMDMCQQSLGDNFSFNHFCFITTLFLFILLCNIIVIIPWMPEPTKDLNTTLALGLLSFLYTQIYAIKSHGIKAYLKEYTSPIFLMFPLHVLGKIASIISISFRLFGNIFGGAIISHIYLSTIEGSIIYETLGLLSGTNFALLFFFGIFEGFLQAFVFTMLTLTYLSIAVQTSHEE